MCVHHAIGDPVCNTSSYCCAAPVVVVVVGIVSRISNQLPPRPLSSFADPAVGFVEGLGTGQITSRQALVSPYLGDIQLSLSDRRGMLEVEVVRARRLQLKPGVKRLPCKYSVC